jgi:hypothetical protein
VRSLALVVLVALAACDRRAESEGEPRDREHAAKARGTATPAGGLVKIILQPETDPTGNAAPIELLLEIDPPAASEGWVEPLAGLVNEALGTCGTAQGEPAPVIEVELGAVRGELISGEGEGELAGCLVETLVGAQLHELGGAPRALRLRVGDQLP